MSVSPVAAVRLATAFPGLVEEVRAAAASPGPLVISGPPALVAELVRGIARDGDASLVRALPVAALREGAPTGATALVYVIRGGVTMTDERALEAAQWHRVPLVCVVLGDDEAYRAVLPIVPATAVVHVSAIDEGALAAVASRIAARGAEAVWPLAASLPLLRPYVLRGLARMYARRGAARELALRALGGRSAIVLNQVRMVLQMAAVKGIDPGTTVLPAALGAGGGLGLALLARRLPGRSGPLAELAAVYVGTRALGRAAGALLERAGAVGRR
jgi:hypothetical protein